MPVCSCCTRRVGRARPRHHDRRPSSPLPQDLSFCPPDRPHPPAHPRPAVRHAWRKWCTAPNDNRDRSIGARLVVALPRGRRRGPVASQTVGALSFLIVWQRVASSQPPMARRQHAGAVQSCLCVVAQRVHTEHRRPFICALSLDATLPPCLVPKASSTLRSKAHPARSARRRDQVKAEPSLFPAAAWPSQSPGRRPRLNPQSARPVPCQKGAGKTGGDFRFAFASRVCAHPTCEVALLTSPWGRRRRKEAAASTHAGGGAPAG